MPDHHSLEETERATQERVGRLAVDFEAAHAVMSLYRAANAARSHLTNTVLRPHDLTWTAFLVLWLLWLWESMETRHVAESVGISKATLTGVMKTLVGRGLVDRVPSDLDRRLVELRLSDEGERLMAELYPGFNKAEAQLVEGLSAPDVAVLTEALRHIVKVAEEHDPTAL
jgi:MarR family transcriptional regulator, organic hydroperoxide resistance regulator